ncbi:PREDICTED: G-protein coupled receptor Mth2 [Vollenhovia emeryi]|uniref:G-protein coupled receptor Mth2 n=1 Tax=Vollenhovia emeryi TaxID=411798 RepID=UPI0005F58671|nr:PREDICTED: G-protein coupled receptor Mth2 [Vollenhovia emeryi]XP_011878016.1 PREDICTED: G-protein coupled receptor Mth2 [Vollenhovia emeryi]
MSATRFALLGLVLLSTRVSSESHLAKCCPPGEIFSGYSTVECVSKPRSIMELYVHQWNTTAGFQGIPRCDEPEDLMTTLLSDLDPNNFLEVPACLEILYDQINGESAVIVVHCGSNKDRRVKGIDTSFLQLTHVRKCCPRDAIFDSRTKACVSRLSESESLVAFLRLRNESADADLVVVANEGPPACKGPIVDYEIDENDVFLRNSTYSVMVPAFKNSFAVKEELSVTEDYACLDTTPDSASDRTLVARVCRDPKFCDVNACIRKCCAENEFFYAQGCNKLAVPDQLIEFHMALANAVNQTRSSAFDTTRDYGVLIGKPCKYGMYPTDPREEEWLLTSEGRVFVEKYVLYDQNNYCMDIFYNMTEFDHNFSLFICFEDPSIKQLSRFRMNTALQITSCAFLLMTLLVYVCLPSLQNLHGKTLMCHVSSLLLAFICLPVITWITPSVSFEGQGTTTCKAVAYITLFSFLSSFSWLNVMCFDIWWTFGVLRGSTITQAREHRKRFLLYCLYAWGLSFLVSGLAIVADSTDILPDYLQPDIGDTSCWFIQKRESYGELTFFIGPVMILLISNVVFFVLTSVHCNKVKAEIKRVTTNPTDPRSKRFRSDRKRFIMNVKLFIVMGMSWICEVVSFFLLKYLDYERWHHVFFYTSDVFNCLQGLLIFILFVLKSRVYQALRRRLGLDTKQKPTCNATTLHDPYRVRKSASSSTLTTTFAISSTP